MLQLPEATFAEMFIPPRPMRFRNFLDGGPRSALECSLVALGCWSVTGNLVKPWLILTQHSNLDQEPRVMERERRAPSLWSQNCTALRLETLSICPCLKPESTPHEVLCTCIVGSTVSLESLRDYYRLNAQSAVHLCRIVIPDADEGPVRQARAALTDVHVESYVFWGT